MIFFFSFSFAPAIVRACVRVLCMYREVTCIRKVHKSINQLISQLTLLFSRDRLFLFCLDSFHFSRLCLRVGTYLTDWLVGWLVGDEKAREKKGREREREKEVDKNILLLLTYHIQYHSQSEIHSR